MNIDSIRRSLEKEYQLFHTFQYVGSRGICEVFSGKIVCIYPRTFMIQTNTGIFKSFSYSDFLIHSLKIVS